MDSATDAPPAGEPPPERPAALGFIYAAIMMNVLSMGVIIPVFPSLVRSLGHVGDGPAAQIMGLFGAAWAVMQLIFAPIFGALSDRFGRRPVVLVSMFGLAFDYLIMALAPSIAWLFVGRLISGITAASGSAAGAYVADVSTAENRARNFGRFMAAANVGIVLGPLLAAVVGQWNPRAPFWVAAALAFINGAVGLFVMPESLSRERRAPFRWASAHLFGSASMLFGRVGLAGLAAMLFIFQFAQMSFNSVFQFYTHYRFNWGIRQLGLLLTVLGFGSMIVQGMLAGAAAKRLGERGAVLLGLSLGSIGFALMGLAPQVWLFWFGSLFLIGSGICTASIQSLMTQRVGANEQGRLQGAASLSMSGTALVGPVIFSSVFAWSIGGGKWLHLPGLSILIGAAVLVIAVIVAFFVAHPAETPSPAALSHEALIAPRIFGE
jgi:DHA1 family tetracycline resistance protein-like MFS transporter